MDIEQGLHSFNDGTSCRAYEILGAHKAQKGGINGVEFRVWAPNAQRISVTGDFNGWNGSSHRMSKLGSSGVWQQFIPDIREGDIYKYKIETVQGEVFFKSDPYGFYSEMRPDTASIVYDLNKYKWDDHEWQEDKKISLYDKPVNIYEVHLGSWRKEDEDKLFNYRELAHELIAYVKHMGYTHIELMPICEYPFDGSWGYQVTGYFAVTSRYGEPKDFMYFVDQCHREGIGVILDWVPAHFIKDSHGLRRFDGTPLYEYAEPKKAEHPHWGTLVFDYAKDEVVSYLISSAFFWLDVYHIDGLRIDAVASMLYLDYGRGEGRWVPNKHGGKVNIEAIEFLKKLNECVYRYFPNVLMIAEESSTWPLVTMPTYLGGLGFGYKWNMGWMNDILKYISLDPIHRKWHHNLLTFSMMYAYSENFVLPLSHDEVVHCKGSLINKIPGDYWQRFATLRVLFGYMIAHPGKKLHFMGGEFAQLTEWNYQKQLDWNLLDLKMNKQFHTYVKDLNHFYMKYRELWELDFDTEGFRWIDPNNYNQSIISFMRKGREKDNFIIVMCNFTPVTYDEYKIGVPKQCKYKEIFNSDSGIYGGSHCLNSDAVKANSLKWHNQPYSIEIKVPPLSIIFIKPEEGGHEKERDSCNDTCRRSRKQIGNSDGEHSQACHTIWREI